jgi:hypothetical protein
MRFLKLSFILGALLATNSIFADGAPKEDAAAAGPLPKDQKEFIEKNSKMNTLLSKISEAEKQFKELVRLKNEAKTTVAKQTIIHEMVALSNQRNKDVDSYSKLKSDLELRYPNQGTRLNRRYQTQQKRSVEELEGVAGLDELLSRARKVVEKKFAPFMEEEEKTEEKKKLAQEPNSEEPKRLRLEK